ncbi:MAG: M14 family metallopeptidase [Aggregatilineales bacterium]
MCIAIITLIVSACQETSVPPADLPTRVLIPSATTLPTELPANPSPTAEISIEFTETPLIPPTQVQIPVTLTPRPTLNISTPTVAPQTAPLPFISPTPARALSTVPQSFVFGQSAGGTNLLAQRLGTGDTLLMLVGGVHGGLETNTVMLVAELIRHFSANPQDILPGISLIFVPELNPDGIALGRTVNGRFNGNGVDLNRNWGCDWSREAVFRDIPVSAGSAPFSEPETISLASLINDLRPATVLFYHSAANGVFAGDCDTTGLGNISAEMSAVLGNATGYSYGQEFSSYEVSGTEANWVDGLGIPSADVELASTEFTEFARNLRGVMALQCWLLGERAVTFAACG